MRSTSKIGSWICTGGSMQARTGRSRRGGSSYPKPTVASAPWVSRRLEDKIVQQAVVTVLNLIYEEDFLGFSYGFRPRRGQHDALDALWVGLMGKKVNWVLDADIQGFFDTIDHGWLLQIPRAPDRRSSDSPPDPQVAEGGRLRRRPMVADRRGNAARCGGFTATGECVPALCLRPVGPTVAAVGTRPAI